MLQQPDEEEIRVLVRERGRSIGRRLFSDVALYAPELERLFGRSC